MPKLELARAAGVPPEPHAARLEATAGEVLTGRRFTLLTVRDVRLRVPVFNGTRGYPAPRARSTRVLLVRRRELAELVGEYLAREGFSLEAEVDGTRAMTAPFRRDHQLVRAPT